MIAVPCVSSDGKPTKSGIATLSVLKGGDSTPKAVAEITSQPMFKVRSGLRELVNAGFVEQINDKYRLTAKGEKLVP